MTGGAEQVLRPDGIESAVAQPRMTFGGEDLYPTLAEKAAALCHSLVLGHPFLDGNKRTGHAAMELFLMLNGLEINAPEAEQEAIMLRLAEGRLSRAELADWLRPKLIPLRYSDSSK